MAKRRKKMQAFPLFEGVRISLSASSVGWVAGNGSLSGMEPPGRSKAQRHPTSGESSGLKKENQTHERQTKPNQGETIRSTKSQQHPQYSWAFPGWGLETIVRAIDAYVSREDRE